MIGSSSRRSPPLARLESNKSILQRNLLTRDCKVFYTFRGLLELEFSGCGGSGGGCPLCPGQKYGPFAIVVDEIIHPHLRILWRCCQQQQQDRRRCGQKVSAVLPQGIHCEK